MPETTYHNRRAVFIEDDNVRLTVLVEGGHVAEIREKRAGVNPLWTPPWPSIEPSTYEPAKHPEYGLNSESKLLAGLMGHNLCMDIFGGPSEEEARAGLSVHGEASTATYAIEASGVDLVARAEFPQSQLRLVRRIRLAGHGVVRFHESLENMAATDRPIAWTQHVTLGPPFLEKGTTRFETTATRSQVVPSDFSGGKGYMKTGAEFEWPHVPRKDTGTADMRTFTDAPVSGGYTAHLMDPTRDQAFFAAFSPSSGVLFGYVWRRADFPWLGIWEENYCRTTPPWNGKTLTRGMEFGVSPFPETRREMIERNGMFGAPGFRWIPARTRVEVQYAAVIRPARSIAEWNPAAAGL